MQLNKAYLISEELFLFNFAIIKKIIQLENMQRWCLGCTEQVTLQHYFPFPGQDTKRPSTSSKNAKHHYHQHNKKGRGIWNKNILLELKRLNYKNWQFFVEGLHCWTRNPIKLGITFFNREEEKTTRKKCTTTSLFIVSDRTHIQRTHSVFIQRSTQCYFEPKP